MKYSKSRKRPMRQPNKSMMPAKPTPPNVVSLLQAAELDAGLGEASVPAQALMIWLNDPMYQASQQQYLYHHAQPLNQPFAFYCEHMLYVIDVGIVQVHQHRYLILIDNQGCISTSPTKPTDLLLGTVIESHPYCLELK